MKSLNIQSTHKASQSGFTIIELVVVILLLGILAATALPRFIDVTDEAHEAVVEALVGGMSTGGALLHAEWVGKGSRGTTVDSYPNIPVSSTLGYPTLANNADCATTFDRMLQGGHPQVSAGSSIVASSTLMGGLTIDAASESFAAGSVISAFWLSGDSACAYIYTAEMAATDPSGAKFFTFSTTGEVDRGIVP